MHCLLSEMAKATGNCSLVAHHSLLILHPPIISFIAMAAGNPASPLIVLPDIVSVVGP